MRSGKNSLLWLMICLIMFILLPLETAIAVKNYSSSVITGSTWGVSNTFISANGSISIRWSGDYYWHNAFTSGYVRNSSGGATPTQVKARARSFELSDTHTTLCQDRYSSQQTGYGTVNAATSSASSNPCGGSPTPSGWHFYYGRGFHWVGTYYGETDIQS